MSKYQNQSLASVPYEDIIVGMEVISAIDVPGKVSEKLDKDIVKHRDNGNWLVVHWDNGNVSTQDHRDYNKVKVK